MRRAAGLLGFAVLVSGVCPSVAEVPEGAGPRMFERMRSLVGDWEGTYAWSGGRADSGKLRVHYYLTGNGSALVEDLIMGDAPTMTTVYHLDGADLRMTHFCAAKNQPRLKAAHIDVGSGAATFSLVDVTNAAANSAYVDGFSLQILGADNLKLVFDFGGSSGKKAEESIVLKRVVASAA